MNPDVPPSPAALDALCNGGRLTITSSEPYRPADGETPPALDDAALSALIADGSHGGSHLAPLPEWVNGTASAPPALEGTLPAASTPLPSSGPVPTLEATLAGILSPYTG